MNKSPKCVYGHNCYSVCVNSQCTMPAFMCETGSKQFDQCGSFHQKCQRIVWNDIQNVINHNPRKKQQQFQNLQQRFDGMFYGIIKSIQEEHLRFKTWVTTYGHSMDIMKFIKNINDQNYKYIDGKNMDMIMTELFGNDRTLIEAPRIRQSDMANYFQKIKFQIQSLRDLYLKSPLQSTHSNSTNSRRQSHNKNKSNQDSYRLTQPSKMKPLDSQIIKDLFSINHFFDGKVKSLKLLYRASDCYFSIAEFHNKCDNVPHTLTLMENQYGKILGGYTPLVWNSSKKNWSPDKQLKTFIFSVQQKQKYKLNLPQFAIANNPQRGPIFGCCDLFISDNADKQKSGCEFPISFNNGKYNRRPQTSEVLTGTPKGKFLLKDWEVFLVQFSETY